MYIVLHISIWYAFICYAINEEDFIKRSCCLVQQL